MVRRRIQSPAGLSLAAALVAAFAIAAFAAVPPNLSKALEAQRRLVTEKPQDAAVHNDLGSLLLLADRPVEAEAAYRRAIELDPDRCRRCSTSPSSSSSAASCARPCASSAPSSRSSRATKMRAPAGQSVRGYPALVDEGDTVGVRVLETPAAQREAMQLARAS